MGAEHGAEQPDPAPFRVAERSLSDDCLDVRVEGELDLNTSPHLDEALERALVSHRHVVLDLQACSFLDSTGITAIVRGRQRLERLGCGLCAYGASKRVDRVLDVAGLKETALIYGDLDAARAALACRP